MNKVRKAKAEKQKKAVKEMIEKAKKAKKSDKDSMAKPGSNAKRNQVENRKKIEKDPEKMKEFAKTHLLLRPKGRE